MNNVILVDNYDSFSHNLARYCEILGYPTKIITNDQYTTGEVLTMKPSHIILSPGPCTPQTAGICSQLIQQASSIPILGICLGHQCLGNVYGAKLTSATPARHGQSCTIRTHHSRIIPQGTHMVGLYHSLSLTTLPPSLRVTAHDQDHQIMAIEHIKYPHFGLQFHPESILTAVGFEVIKNFIQINPC